MRFGIRRPVERLTRVSDKEMVLWIVAISLGPERLTSVTQIPV